MTNISDKVESIRKSIYGKDVRESIASGIEAINAEVVSTTGRQNVIDAQEQTRINAENIRISNETARQSNEAARQTTFTTNEAARQTAYNISEQARNDSFNTNETVRQNAETIRISNEDGRVVSFQEMEDKFAAMEHADPTLEVVAARGGEVDLATRLNKSDAIIQNGNVVTPSIGYGMNSVIKLVEKASASLKLSFIGETNINLMGSIGNCEDISKWSNPYNCTVVLDSTNKMFGNNGIKVTTTTATSGNFGKHIYVSDGSVSMIDKTKYYCLSGYLKNGNISNGVQLGFQCDGGNNVFSELVTDSTKFSRKFVKIQPTDMANATVIYAIGAKWGTNTIGQYAYMDGVMITEITAAQYADSSYQPGPYVDSYACLTNPSVEVRHDNMIINGDGEEGVGYWLPGYYPGDVHTGGAITKSSYGLTLTDSNGNSGYYQTVAVKPNTVHCIKYESSDTTGNATISIYGEDKSLLTGFGVGEHTFNTGNNSHIHLTLYNGSALNVVEFRKIMLVEGTIAPLEYKSCRREQVVIEGQFADGDIAHYQDGKATGSYINQHAILYGKDYDWQFSTDYVGFKLCTLLLTSTDVKGTFSANDDNVQGIKYDGKVLPNDDPTSASDRMTIYATLKRVQLSVSDSDTGWTETLSPNNDEAKAVANGWKAIFNNGTRYIAFESIMDKSLPSIAAITTLSTAFGANSTAVVVTDITKLNISAGDIIGIKMVTHNGFFLQ